MNRIERRIAGTSGSRPGAPVCNPGQPNQPVRGMLGGNSQLYQTPQWGVCPVCQGQPPEPDPYQPIYRALPIVEP